MQLNFRVKKSVNYTFDYLTDMQKFVTVHPVITKIEKFEDKRFMVYETLKLLFMPFSFTYPVILTSDANANTVVFNATIMKLTKVEMKFVIESDNENSIVTEYVSIKSLLPIKSMLIRVFRKHHKQLFVNIEESHNSIE